MIAPEEALRLILKQPLVLAPQKVRLGSSADRVLAEDVHTREDLPPLDNSAVDGFAVRSPGKEGATDATLTFRVRETVRAGGGACPTGRGGSLWR